MMKLRYLTYAHICLFYLVFFGSATLFAQKQPELTPYSEGNLWGYCNPKTGQVSIPLSFDSVGMFQITYDEEPCPLAWVKKNGKYGLINAMGTQVLPLVEPKILPLTRICLTSFMVERYAFDATSESEEREILDEQEDKIYFRPVAYFNALGQPVVEPFIYANRIDGYRYIDHVVPYDLDNAQQIPESLLNKICNYRQIWKSGKTGLCDIRTGRVLLKPEFIFIQTAERVAFTVHHFLDTAFIGRRNALINFQTDKEWSIPDSIRVTVTPGTGNLILAQNTRTYLYGFISPEGQTVLPFSFMEAMPYSPNGRTRVQCMDSIWYWIDTKGRNISRLGKSPFEFTDNHGYVWFISDSDGFYRIRHAPPDLPLGRIGLDYLPEEVKVNGKTYWIARKGYKSGLLDQKGRKLLPFEFDLIEFRFSRPIREQDFQLSKKYFSVTKNDRKWVYNIRTMQPLQPKLETGNGLILGKTFDQSNFSLIQPIVGDSIFLFELSHGKTDILNIRTGKRWNIPNNKSYDFCYEGARESTYLCLYVTAADGSWTEEHFYFDGRRAPK